MFLDHGLTIEVRDTCLAIRIAHGRVHRIGDSRRVNSIKAELTESGLRLHTLLVRGGHKVSDVDSLGSSLDRCAIPKIPRNDLSPQLLQFVRSRAAGLTRHGPHVVASLEENPGQASPLLPCRARYQYASGF